MTTSLSTQPPLPVGSQGQAISVISNKYRLSRRLGGGSFGDIYLGEYIPTSEKVAIKFEKHGARCPQLRHEYKVYRELQPCPGFGKVHYFGQIDCFNVMVMELLGYSLEDLFNKCGRRFSLRTVLQLADQVLERVEVMHNRHLIHRDIKPANFVVGHGPTAAIVHCIDFGLSKRYRHPRTLQHIAYRDGRSLTGTPRYASINNHLGIEQSRRDDLESIGYVLVYFLRGILPWQGLKAKTASKKYKMIMEKKQTVSVSELCQGCPAEFAHYLTYCRSLSFDGKPDMGYLRGLFRDLYVQQGFGSYSSTPSTESTIPSHMYTRHAGVVTGSAALLAASAGPIQWDWDRFVNPAYYAATPAPATTGVGGGRGGDKGRGVAGAGVASGGKVPAAGGGRGGGRIGAGGGDVMDVTSSDDHLKATAAGAGAGGGEGGREGGVVMMQTSEMEARKVIKLQQQPQQQQQQQQQQQHSPLNQLKQSLRISDDGDINHHHHQQQQQRQQQNKPSHKRHLSLSQGVEGGVEGEVAGTTSDKGITCIDSTGAAFVQGAAGGGGVAGGWVGGGGGVVGGMVAEGGYKQQMGGSRAKTGHPMHEQQQRQYLQQQQQQQQQHMSVGRVEMPGSYAAVGRTAGEDEECTFPSSMQMSSDGGGGALPIASAGAATAGGSNMPAAVAATAAGVGVNGQSNKQDSFLNGFLRKAKSFARPTAASSANLSTTTAAGGEGGGGGDGDRSSGNLVGGGSNPAQPPTASLTASASPLAAGAGAASLGRPRISTSVPYSSPPGGGPTVSGGGRCLGGANSSSSAAVGKSGATATARIPSSSSSSSSSKHVNAGFGQSGLAVPS
ncbi:hypothetical protein VYU27_001844 [Nannochloropsis oceanica]